MNIDNNTVRRGWEEENDNVEKKNRMEEQKVDNKTTIDDKVEENRVVENKGGEYRVVESEKIYRNIVGLSKDVVVNRNKDCKRLYMIGFDAVALYPSMKERNTARVCREQLVNIVGNGDIQLKGIDMEQVTLYIRMNKNLTNNIGRLWKYLPFRKKTGGVEPGMASEGAKKVKGENACFGRVYENAPFLSYGPDLK